MAVSISEPLAYKRLVTAGNNKVYYEDIDVAAGTMTELVAADGNIDTSDQLNMFEAFQKVFIVNGANLKVADFINTKLTSNSEITTYLPAHGDVLTQDQTGGKYAYMVVDYISAWAGGAHLIYGYAYYAGTATAFTTTYDVKDADGNTVIASANLTTVTAKPHWYDWTVYNGDTSTYGTMPNKAYLGCLYNGRGVISGNPEEPNQWYMTRQFNLWDFAYLANDAQTPIRGGNANAGLLGDIIRSLVSHKDTFLAFGCASTMSIMMGDPAMGGIIRSLDRTTGIYGAKSWCFDKKGNLYFWGANGIYKCAVPQVPVCITQVSLPQLVSDEAADPSTYRITMEYDHLETGILIAVTKLSDGSNSNYWLDLKVTDPTPEICPLFPETYPDECGPYSLFYYAANDTDYRGLLVGCKDGFIRKFDKSSKSDNIGGTTQLIDSYCVFGPTPLSNLPNKEGKIGPISIITGGSASGTTEPDSDDVDYKVYVADTAAGVIDKIKAGSAPIFAGTILAPGWRRGSCQRQSARGTFAGIKLGNDTKDESWILECLVMGKKPSGRLK
jgi:hypothetical protein